MARETDIEYAVVAWAENHGWIARKMIYAGRRGCPDHFFFGKGKIVVIEFKRPGGYVDAVQEREHARLLVAGTKVHVVRDVDAGIALLS